MRNGLLIAFLVVTYPLPLGLSTTAFGFAFFVVAGSIAPDATRDLLGMFEPHTRRTPPLLLLACLFGTLLVAYVTPALCYWGIARAWRGWRAAHGG